MPTLLRGWVGMVVLGMGLGLATAAVAEETWPARPVRLIVPTAPGGPTDIVARLLAERLSRELGQQFIIDNRAGAGHLIGMAATAQSAPDGYTFAAVSTPLVVAPAVHPKMPYDTQRDLVPVSLWTTQPLVLVVAPRLNVRSVADLVALARRRPTELNMASAGNTTGPHLAGEELASMAGLKVTHVPYKGGPQATAAILAGEADFYFDTPASALPHIAAGKLIALGVSSAKRFPGLPDIPTVAEQGLPGFDFESWVGLVAPRGTPQAIIDQMQSESAKALGDADIRARLAGLALEPVGSTSEQFKARVTAELGLWQKLVKERNITSD